MLEVPPNLVDDVRPQRLPQLLIKRLLVDRDELGQVPWHEQPHLPGAHAPQEFGMPVEIPTEVDWCLLRREVDEEVVAPSTELVVWA